MSDAQDAEEEGGAAEAAASEEADRKRGNETLVPHPEKRACLWGTGATQSLHMSPPSHPHGARSAPFASVSSATSPSFSSSSCSSSSSNSSSFPSSFSSSFASSPSSSAARPGAEGEKAPPAISHERAGSMIIISHRQKGNDLLRFITAVPHSFAHIAPDFLVGPCACALFLSLRYHQLFPSYLLKRLEGLAGAAYTRRFLLLHVDLTVPDAPLAQVTLLAFHHRFSLLLGSSLQECAGILQLLKVYENKPADALLAKLDSKHSTRVMEALTAISPVNKTDVLTLAGEFRTVKGILLASRQALERCPGIGEKKAKKILKVARDPFFASQPSQTKLAASSLLALPPPPTDARTPAPLALPSAPSPCSADAGASLR
ncbi:DNA repair protein rad10 subfamily protein [Besnoitia besnoiti]|uniref:DNA repair protein rad10 subfamily protein n=1 Tax=Besnoitia besnoiti TaxID=94643 RepID=A0A2A9MHS0_BESBE|nr:DNA repair protein rad10 subfamily protein [Besnoitia besnoiti]PFH38088.1 DNA repair protein rad10 subfamily protein [Besnoitia besnoiti]